jgi:hypothetical protein
LARSRKVARFYLFRHDGNNGGCERVFVANFEFSHALTVTVKVAGHYTPTRWKNEAARRRLSKS